MSLSDYLCVVSCVLSFVNLVAVLFLSNALFRIFSGNSRTSSLPKQNESGLVEVREVPTYDPRFRR